MSQPNVIITSGSRNQVIHVPVVTSTTRSATPIEIVTSASASLTLNTNNNTNINLRTNTITPNHNQQKQSTVSKKSSTSTIKTGTTNKDLFNDDNSEIKTVYMNSEKNNSREQLLLPTDTIIKQEVEEDQYEEYESMEEEVDIEGIVNAKTQYKCSGCGKGFCYKGWLDKHSQSSPACRNAHPIAEKSFSRESNASNLNLNRERPSLEGRLNELLCCPNENCSFTTHWVQSLNKHVFTACKFGKPNKEDVSLRSSGRRTLNQSQNNDQTNVCHLCNKSFTDTHLHIQHMKTAHQIKLLYQCSECKMNFDTKYDSELHIEEVHNNGEDVDSKTYPNAENTVSNGVQQCWTCDACNKTYLSMRSYEIHRESCEKASLESQRTSNKSGPTNSAGVSKNSNLRAFPKSNSMTHFRREQIEAIHIHDFECRYCHKEFNSSNGLCNHLSRRPFCREWYYTNLPIELKKRNSLHLMPKSRNKVKNGFHRFSSVKHSSKQLSNSLLIRTKKVVNRKKSEENGDRRSRSNSARCNRCRKIFVGKNPTVALTNHLRGSTCNPTKFNSSQKPEIVRSRTFNKPVNKGQTPKSLSENRFYCKLCEKLELKNRVSLGCHLTIYHGLPQVNVSNENGDAFRCQTCSQIFESKYFYNVHRQDCDLTSPYVGIISGDEISQIQQNVDNGHPIDDEEMTTSLGVTCGLCGRTGFSSANQVNMHQKYQCVKRHQKKSKQKRFQPSIKAQKNIKIEDNGTLTCDQCGRGPYNSFSHYLEHKKKYCNALKDVSLQKNNSQQLSDGPNRAKKSFSLGTASSTSASKENFCLNPTVPRARKTINFANASSPQVSHDSSAPMDTNDNELEEVVPIVPEVTKCSVCPEEFEDILAFIRHRLGHLTEELTINESVDAIECELCGARVHHYQRIQQHLILHLQNVQILKKKNLIEVMKRKHNKESEIESDDEDQDSSRLHCPYCKSEYSSRTELANHIKKTCPFRYQCSTCNNTYSAKESYLEHKEYCSKNSNSVKTVLIAPTYKCRNCNVEFKIKQQLLWHEHSCNKVYAADHSGRVEEVIERTLTCSVCGLVSEVYDRKVKHERQCLQRFLAVIGNTTEEIESNKEELLKPLDNKMDFDLTSLSNTSDSSEVPENVINNLKEEHGIGKDLKVVLTGFDEQLIRKLKNQIYSESDETNQFEALKVSFMTLVRRLTKNDEILFEMSQDSSAEVLLTRMLKYLGEQPIQHNGLNELNCFRQNLQTFLKLTIKDDTLILAYREAESVDEAIVNMLNFECEFDS